MININCISYSKTHKGVVRSHNEDALLDMPNNSIWVVADGMGGHSAGDIASQMFIDGIEEFISVSSYIDISDIKEEIYKINNDIFIYSEDKFPGKTIGTTFVLLFLKDGIYHCLWAGDSRIYIFRNGKLSVKTKDHSQVMELVNQGVLTINEIENHPLSNVITRAVGVGSSLDIDHVFGKINDNDTFILCSDGLTNELSDIEIENSLRANCITESGLALLHSCLVRGASDNVSYIIVKAHQVDLYNGDITVPMINNNGFKYE